ncbi:redoxin family protein [Candidatus Woesearchaeota archaeon]|nr:redoxin family protein [Candidatus Woesearchaeota archaeon]
MAAAAWVLAGVIVFAVLFWVVVMNSGKDAGLLKAPELRGISGFINGNVSVGGSRGKVVLVDFWTYSCVNCIRTLPYLNEWDRKYRDSGLVIIGVHTPEFEFEKDIRNVQSAVDKYGIRYPVALDNGYESWRAYRNAYWPRKYLVDVDGYIRYDHIGEGGYEETERVIQELLGERSGRLAGVRIDESVSSPESAVAVDFSRIRTPELYFGYRFMRKPLGNREGHTPEVSMSYSVPSAIQPDTIYLSGEWRSRPDFMELVSVEGEVLLSYDAGAVNFVAGSDRGSSVGVSLDGGGLDSSNSGEDVNGSVVSVKEFRMYNSVRGDYGRHKLSLKVKGSGFRVYAFTFG